MEMRRVASLKDTDRLAGYLEMGKLRYLPYLIGEMGEMARDIHYQ